MKGSLDNHLKNEIKTLIIENCDLDIDVGDIDDNLPLFERKSELALDSIDALQISIAIQNTYSITRRISLLSINTFADFLQPG